MLWTLIVHWRAHSHPEPRLKIGAAATTIPPYTHVVVIKYREKKCTFLVFS